MTPDTTAPSSVQSVTGSDNRIYPVINIERIANPNRLWAIPILGGLVKYIILIPVLLWVLILFVLTGAALAINSLKVLFTGKYWDISYRLNLGLLRLYTKFTFFFNGLTDKYPGFSLNINDSFTVDIAYPVSPNRLFALPVIGILARLILAIPFLIYLNIMQVANFIGVYVVSSLVVLFSGKYPESTFELFRDNIRLSFAWMAYSFGLSDTYPSFRISMNHRATKLVLIGLGALYFIYTSIFPLYGAISGPLESYRASQKGFQLDPNFYVNENVGFKIRPPKDWLVEEVDAGFGGVRGVIFSSVLKDASFNVGLQPTGDLDLDAYFETNKQELLKLEDYELIREGETVIGGTRGRIIDGTLLNVRLKQIILVSGDNAYIITAGTTENLQEEYFDLFEASIQTFKLL